MKQYFVLTGSIRSGSTWLTEMFKQNGNAKHLVSLHEAFSQKDAKKRIKLWQREKAGIFISSGHDAAHGEMMFTLEAALHPRWFFLWREPLELLRSIMGWKGRRGTKVPTADAIMARAHITFNSLNKTLKYARQLGVEPEHWLFEHYTTIAGFKALAKSMGVPLKAKVVDVAEKNATPRRRVFNEKAWPQRTKDLVRDLTTPEIVAAMAKGRARMAAT